MTMLLRLPCGELLHSLVISTSSSKARGGVLESESVAIDLELYVCVFVATTPVCVHVGVLIKGSMSEYPLSKPYIQSLHCFRLGFM